MKKKSGNEGLRKMLSRPASDFEAPEWLVRIGPFLIASWLVGVGLLWIGLVPPLKLDDPAYIVASIGWMIISLWWSGREPIPGKRQAATGLQHNWLVIVAGLALTLTAGTLAGRLQDAVSTFAWAFFGGAAKLTVDSLFIGKLLFCEKCGRRRWGVKSVGAFYCTRCGRKVDGAVPSHSAGPSTLSTESEGLEK